jgi:hypothetical protein
MRESRARRRAVREWLVFVGLSLGLLLVPQSAAAIPGVTLKATAVPIAGVPHTGNALGAGAALQVEYTISGTEYGGFPQPLDGIILELPRGVVVSPSAFPTCPRSTLESTGKGPMGCPTGSSAGPVGVVDVLGYSGGKIGTEEAKLESFYASDGGLEFFVFGHEPTFLEEIWTARYSSRELISKIPRNEESGRDVSIDRISFTLGSALRRGAETIYYYRLPAVCPTGGFPLSAELSFVTLEEPVVTVTKTYRMPCPGRTLETPEPPATPVHGTGAAVTAPSNSSCLSRRDLVIHVNQTKGVIYRRVAAAIDGRPVAVLRGSRTHARFALKGLPKGAYKLRITLTTTTGRTVSGTRVYHTCLPGH